MKKTFKLYASVFVLTALVFSGCNKSEDVITADAKEGAFLTIAGSSGSLAGAPASSDLENAEIDFESTELTYSVAVAKGASSVAELVVYKTYGSQRVEAGRTSESAFVVEFTSVADFLEGLTDVTEESLRIGDVFSFQTEIIMKDGRSLVNAAAVLNVQISCLADLSGDYLVTNTSCPADPDFPLAVTITKNSDGSYEVSQADGGFLNRCTGNTAPGFANVGNIVEQCGTILPSTDLAYGSAGGVYDIGDITGGTWDDASGTLILHHTQSFFATRPSEWTSTFIRQ